RQRGHATAVVAPDNSRGADAFDFLQERGRLLLGEHLAYQCAEPAHVVAQGKGGWGELESAWGVHRCALLLRGKQATRQLSRVLCNAAKVSGVSDVRPTHRAGHMPGITAPRPRPPARRC